MFATDFLAARGANTRSVFPAVLNSNKAYTSFNIFIYLLFNSPNLIETLLYLTKY